MKPNPPELPAGRRTDAAADGGKVALRKEARRLADQHIELLRVTSRWLRDLDGPTIGDQVAADLHGSRDTSRAAGLAGRSQAAPGEVGPY